jgi:uncharacterized protein
MLRASRSGPIPNYQGRDVTDSQDLALLLTSSVVADGQEAFPLDNIRMQKAMFLLTKRGTERMRNAYDYQPYNWGPYSKALASDLRELETADLLDVETVPSSRYGRFKPTPQGEQRSAETWAGLTTVEQDFIRSVRKYVTARPFAQLLREVYAAYPDYASKSLFTG